MLSFYLISHPANLLPLVGNKFQYLHPLPELEAGSTIRNVRQQPAVKPKALFVIDTLEIGGAEYSLFQTVIRFRNLVPVACHLYAGETLKQQFLEHSIKVYSVDIFEKYSFHRAYKCLSEIVKHEKPDIIVAYLTRSELVSRIVGKRYKIPVIGTLISDLYSNAYNKNLRFHSRLNVKLFRMINKATIRFCKGFIANSEFVRESNSIQLSIPQNKIITIHRGRDKSKFRFRIRNRKPGAVLKFLSIGRLVRVKDHETQIRAFKMYLHFYPAAELHIAGEGPERSTLTKLICELDLANKVLLLGNQNNLPALVENYDCFISSSLSEGFSGALVEAVFAGLPVIASDIPPNREIVQDLESGYLFESGSAQSLVNVLKWFTENPQQARQFSETAFDAAKEKYDLDKTATVTERFLLSMIN